MIVFGKAPDLFASEALFFTKPDRPAIAVRAPDCSSERLTKRANRVLHQTSGFVVETVDGWANGIQTAGIGCDPNVALGVLLKCVHTIVGCGHMHRLLIRD